MSKCNIQNNLIKFTNASSQDAVKATASDGQLLLECNGAFNSGFVKLAGVANPIAANQAANKAYVDAHNPAGSVLLAPSGTQTITTHPLALTAGTTSTSTTTGTLVVTGGGGFSGDVNVGGDVECVNLVTSSDKNLKKNIRDLGTDDRFDQIHPVSFNWKSDNKLASGVIAQDLRELYPEMVSEDIESGMLSVRYLELIAVLIAEVQALKKVVEQIE